ncbi:hypothetical protein SAMN05216262_102313 [Colwellia chukchiensis]|uniref:Uncharacterized protein n=1 Tax=Colwellia chukchiensis TaxID=641665 RepID=A0A1H7JRW2_9GAMM|nr:hypothetical protein [Colwellia chukchiensis]SEK76557.1 hypothetical protein SAMN05216262_102313 [Colwellia chukchiensis]
MPIDYQLQKPSLQNIPFMGSGNRLEKKEVSVGSKVIVKELSGQEHKVLVIGFESNQYFGENETGKKIKFSKENVFLIL